MTSTIGYVLGYSEGRSDAERSRNNQELASRVFDGRRPVTVDQSHLDELIARAEKFRSDSNLNFRQANLFEREAHQWKAESEQHETRAKALQAQVVALQAQLGERDAALEREQATRQTIEQQNHGLNLFRLIATWLIDAHIAGRIDRPAFAEMRDMAKLVTDAIERGETFYGYRDEPEKKVRLQALLEELLRA